MTKNGSYSQGHLAAAKALDGINDSRCLTLVRSKLVNLLRSRDLIEPHPNYGIWMPDWEAPDLAEYVLMAEKYGKGDIALAEVKNILLAESRSDVFRIAAMRIRTQMDDVPFNRAAAERYERLAKTDKP